ncbi:MAG: tRNA (adenosine(37)-N6)-threonylcarbamoyltransferase complex dimerization subunit type 1 TsaB [Desulfovibrionaceae bacterium]
MTSPASSPPDPGLLLTIAGAEETLLLALGQADAAGKPPRLLTHRQWTAPGRFMTLLHPGLDEMLRELGRPAADVGRIACVAGPGSFTGLRITLAAAEGLALATGAATAGLDHLALLAREPAAQDASHAGGTLAVVTHSRMRQVYVQAFRRPDAAPLGPARPLSLDQAAAALAALPGPVAALGSGLRRNAEFFDALAAATPDLTLLPPDLDRPRPEALLAAAAEADFGPGPIEPVYLRPSDAEENLDAIARARGIDPARARADLDAARGRP